VRTGWLFNLIGRFSFASQFQILKKKIQILELMRHRIAVRRLACCHRVTETSHLCSVLGLFLVEDSDLGVFSSSSRENGVLRAHFACHHVGVFFLRLRLRAVVAGVYIIIHFKTKF
jgi:hypothetical protein